MFVCNVTFISSVPLATKLAFIMFQLFFNINKLSIKLVFLCLICLM